MGQYCIAPGCANESYGGCLISFHLFPKDEEVKRKWLTAIGKTSVGANARLCHHHFREDDFYFDTALRRKLKINAVPTIFYGKMNSKEIHVPNKPQVVRQPTLTIISKEIENTELDNEFLNPALVFEERENYIPKYIDQSTQTLPQVSVASTQTLKNASHVSIQTKLTEKESLMRREIYKVRKQNQALKEKLALLNEKLKKSR